MSLAACLRGLRHKADQRSADGRCYPSQGPPDRGGPSAQKGGSKWWIGRTKGGLNSKLHTVTDGLGRPLRMLQTAGQDSDHRGAGIFMWNLPPAKILIPDRGYDADWLRDTLKEKGISPCMPSRRNRKKPIPHDEEVCRKRHVIENNFAKFKDCCRIATRYGRCPELFLSARTLGRNRQALAIGPDTSEPLLETVEAARLVQRTAGSGNSAQ